MKVGVVTYREEQGPPHFRPNREQVMFVLEGKMRMAVGDEERIAKAGFLDHIPRNIRHGVCALRGPQTFLAAKLGLDAPPQAAGQLNATVKEVSMPNVKSMPIGILRILIAVLTLLIFPSVASAADAFPTRPMRAIVAVSPGGSNDFVTRLIAAKLSERLGEQVVVVNRAGGGGVIGYELGARATPDGYTMVLASASYAALAATRKTPYDPIKSFAPIAKLGTGPFLLIVNSNVPANSVKELIALAKQRPGELIMASGEVASAPHLGTELFLRLTGIDIRVVPFKGGGPALINILGGHSDVTFSNIVQALPHIKSGRLRPLGTGGSKRSVVLPDVPTIAQAADLPGFETANWWSFLAPAGTPSPIVNTLTNEIRAILALDEVKKWFLNAGGDVDYLSPTELGRFMEQEITKFKRIAKEANIKLD